MYLYVCIHWGMWVRGWCLLVVTHKPCVDQPWIYQITNCIMTLSFITTLKHSTFKFIQTLQPQVFGQDITRRTSRFFIGHRPPHVYLTSCMGFFLPGLPPPFLHTASDQKLEAGTAWERSYECGASTVAGLIPRHVWEPEDEASSYIASQIMDWGTHGLK